MRLVYDEEWQVKAWQITDAGSKNFTVVDGQRLSAGKPHSLGPVATIGFGEVNARFLVPDALPETLGERLGAP